MATEFVRLSNGAQIRFGELDQLFHALFKDVFAAEILKGAGSEETAYEQVRKEILGIIDQLDPDERDELLAVTLMSLFHAHKVILKRELDRMSQEN